MVKVLRVCKYLYRRCDFLEAINAFLQVFWGIQSSSDMFHPCFRIFFANKPRKDSGSNKKIKLYNLHTPYLHVNPSKGSCSCWIWIFFYFSQRENSILQKISKFVWQKWQIIKNNLKKNDKWLTNSSNPAEWLGQRWCNFLSQTIIMQKFKNRQRKTKGKNKIQKNAKRNPTRFVKS